MCTASELGVRKPKQNEYELLAHSKKHLTNLKNKTHNSKPSFLSFDPTLQKGGVRFHVITDNKCRSLCFPFS